MCQTFKFVCIYLLVGKVVKSKMLDIYKQMIGLGVSTRSCPTLSWLNFRFGQTEVISACLARVTSRHLFTYCLRSSILLRPSVYLYFLLPPPPPPRFNRISCKQESNCKNHDFSSFLPFSFLSLIIFSSFSFFMTFLSRHLCYFLCLFAFLLCIFLHISPSTIISFSFLPPLLHLFSFTVTFLHLFVTSYSLTLTPDLFFSFLLLLLHQFFFTVTHYYFFFVLLPLLTHFFSPLSFHLFLPPSFLPPPHPHFSFTLNQFL